MVVPSPAWRATTAAAVVRLALSSWVRDSKATKMLRPCGFWLSCGLPPFPCTIPPARPVVARGLPGAAGKRRPPWCGSGGYPLSRLLPKRVACQVLPVKGGRLGAVAVDTPYLASCRSARSLSPHAMSVEEPIELRITPLQHAQDLPRLPAVEAEALDEAHPYAQATMPPAALQTQHDSVRHAGPVRRRRLAVVTAGVAGEEG